MSLPDVTFTNNLGVLSFKHCLIGVTDTWEFDGRVSRHVKSISVDAHVRQGGVGEEFTTVSSEPGTDGKRFGELGVLNLPWTDLRNVKLTELAVSENIWIDWLPVQAVFADEWPDFNTYTLSFFGITIYNPRLSFPVPKRALKDDYPQMPWKPGSAFAASDPRVGVFRTRAAEKNMEISLQGSIRITDSKLPPGIVETLIQRNRMTPSQPASASIATGWMRSFNLGDAIPEVTKDLNLAHVMVIGATLTWKVEQETATISIQMLCPPQLLG